MASAAISLLAKGRPPRGHFTTATGQLPSHLSGPGDNAAAPPHNLENTPRLASGSRRAAQPSPADSPMHLPDELGCWLRVSRKSGPPRSPFFVDLPVPCRKEESKTGSKFSPLKVIREGGRPGLTARDNRPSSSLFARWNTAPQVYHLAK